MKTMTICTSNVGKKKEFQKFFSTQSLVSIDFPFEEIEVQETGDTFAQNAFIKASAYGNSKYGKNSCILTEDSGLVLDAFPDLLGVQTARYMAHLPSYEQRANQLLMQYTKNNELNLAAKFVCVICLWFSPSEVYFFHGHVRGMLANSWRDPVSWEAGFGYDGLFIPDGQISRENQQTFSQNPELKAQNSHRTQALKELQKFLGGFLALKPSKF